MTRDEIETQILDQKTVIAHVELQLKLPRSDREGQKDGIKLRVERDQAKKRVRELEKWLASGFFKGRGGGSLRQLPWAA